MQDNANNQEQEYINSDRYIPTDGKEYTPGQIKESGRLIKLAHQILNQKYDNQKPDGFGLIIAAMLEFHERASALDKQTVAGEAFDAGVEWSGDFHAHVTTGSSIEHPDKQTYLKQLK